MKIYALNSHTEMANYYYSLNMLLRDNDQT